MGQIQSRPRSSPNVLAEEKEFGKWLDGQVAKVYYTTQGKVTTDSLDAQIRQPGTYYLSFSNTSPRSPRKPSPPKSI